MSEQFSRTERLIGADALNKLKNARVAVFGIGGVGSYTVEALARAGVGALDLIDNDDVAESNLNRQIIALHSTVGKAKVDVAAARVKDINPNCTVTCHKMFVLPENIEQLPLSSYDFIVDAIDTVSSKIALAVLGEKLNIKVISSMGTGNKLDPTKFEVTDIYKTSVCPLARVMRTELKKRGIKKLKVVYSKEEPIKVENVSEERRRAVPASISFVPSVAGLIIAGEIIKDLIK
ncbi:MAG: tRNA threonylcarbamoyladenosine dehydratase [Clostridia bacterium]|nr:tRNA threonylcarbamoyladenosine dehydratase [Clostridia bacterium]